jgi:DNA repair protein RadA/Sms
VKSKIAFQCQACGATAPKWSGQCGECGAWNSLIEVIASQSGATTRGRSGSALPAICTLGEVPLVEEMRTPTGLSELDRVLGGGLVAGSVVLLGGDPGIGKSTLLLQMLASLSQAAGLKVLYVSGEESAQQVALRARRLDLKADSLRLLTETHSERILELAGKETPRVMVIDSIQTVYTELLGSAPGSVGQVRESAAMLVRYAKHTGTAVFLVGHVTKEGALAGPRVLEHMVDTVLYFEGDGNSRFRIVRAIKNRFGAANELGVFAMTDRGLREVSSPSAIFLSQHDFEVAGSVVMVTREGTRPLLVEVQALVDQSSLANPRRVAVGLDPNRLSMLLAVLHRHGGVASYGQDVFINVVGGVRINETGADLAVALAVLSSLRNRPLAPGLVVFGEIGLAGEIRPVQSGPERLREAAKHGFKRAIVPKANVPKAGGIPALEVMAVSRLNEALELI